MTFDVGLLSLSRKSLRFMHSAACIGTLFLFVLNNIPLCIYAMISLPVHPLIDV